MGKKKILVLVIVASVLVAALTCWAGIVYLDNLKKYQIPDTTLGGLMPKPESKYGALLYSNDSGFMIEVHDVDAASFASYAQVLRSSGFIYVTSDQSCNYTAYNAEGKYISATHLSAENKMHVAVFDEFFLPDLTYENIRIDDKLNIITNNLNLPSASVIGEAESHVSVKWESSHPDIISVDGTVTRPESGTTDVILTATVSETGEMKHFAFRVPGADYNNGTLIVENDYNPVAGVGIVYEDVIFTLDKTNNSVIRDLGEKKRVNYVVLSDVDDINPISQANVSLWVSDDNFTYEMVDNIKILASGKQSYLYNFDVDARYIKVHYNLCPDGLDAKFIAGLGDMIRAGYEENIGGNGASFKETEYVLTNLTGKDQLDYAWQIAKSELGITGSDASIRIYIGDDQLYHYVSGSDVIIRVPDLLAGESVTLKVRSSDCNNVLNMANKEYVYEVTYGYREQWTAPINQNRRFRILLEKGTVYPSGRVQEETVVLAQTAGGKMCVSKDGGVTWEHLSTVQNNPGPDGEPVLKFNDLQGYLLDTHTNRIYIAMRSCDQAVFTDGIIRANYIIRMAYSDDGGLTWNQGPTVPYSLNPDDNNGTHDIYSDGIVSSTYDGDGPNVDYVWHTGQFLYQGEYGVLCYARPIYSRDCGKTWEHTETLICGELLFGGKNSPAVGLSEGQIYVRDDGILISLVRNQYDEKKNWAIIFSTDGGATWTKPEDSRIYAVNSCPVIHNVSVNGETTTLVNYGGYNALGGSTFARVPMIFAHTTNGEDIRNIQNATFQTHLENGVFYSIVTNTSYTKSLDGVMTVAWQNVVENAFNYMTILDFDKWYTRTKGAYDSFENGSAQLEGWMIQNGDICVDKMHATHGSYALHANRITKLTRSIPYLQDGKVTLNVYASEGLRLEIELQAAYNNVSDSGVAPVGIKIHDNVITFLGSDEATNLVMAEGWNTLEFDLVLSDGKATFQLNGGDVVDMPVDMEAGDYVTYVTLLGRSEYFVDELLVVSETEVDLAASEADKAAAESVIAQIKTMGTDANAIAFARAAYNGLSIVQRDFVNRYTFEDGVRTNYYEVLKKAELSLYS